MRAEQPRSEQPTPPEWEAWTNGTGRCPICEGLPNDDFEAICDCWQYEREQRSDR